MSYALKFDFEVATTKNHPYWWPILCEVVGEYGFQFNDPLLEERKGGYLYTRREETTDIRIGSFVDFWNEIYAGVDVMTAIFWYQGKAFEGMNVEITTGWNTENSSFTIALEMPGACVMDEAEEKVKERLLLMLACAKRLYTVCQPAKGESYWITPGPDTTAWAVFGKAPSQPFDLGYPHRKQEQQLVIQPLSDGKELYFFNPSPYAHINREKGIREISYVSLINE